MSQLGQKYNKQGYGLDRKGTWKRGIGQFSPICRKSEFLGKKETFFWAKIVAIMLHFKY